MFHSLATRLATVATMFLGLVLVTAGKADAMHSVEPAGHTSTVTPVQTAADGSNSTLLLMLLVTTIVVALALGAASIHLLERRAHRGQLA